VRKGNGRWRAPGRNEEDDRASWRQLLNDEIPELKWITDMSEDTGHWLEVTTEFFWDDFHHPGASDLYQYPDSLATAMVDGPPKKRNVSRVSSVS
jgi:hypothetical protein